MLTIVWDVDDVLNELMREWLYKKWLRENPSSCCHYEEITVNPPEGLLGITRKEYLRSLDEFRKEQMMTLKPNAEVVGWFEQYGYRYRHQALTATPLSCAALSAYWVTHHFGRWIRGFHFVPSLREGQETSQYETTKREYLEWFGKADIFIDDNYENVKAAEHIGIKSFLVARPWNHAGMELTEILQELTKEIKDR